MPTASGSKRSSGEAGLSPKQQPKRLHRLASPPAVDPSLRQNLDQHTSVGDLTEGHLSSGGQASEGQYVSVPITPVKPQPMSSIQGHSSSDQQPTATTDQPDSAVSHSDDEQSTARQIEIEMMDALDECPNCLKSKSQFKSPPIFREHVQYARCRFGKAQQFNHAHELNECPKCLRPRADFSDDYVFVEHVREDCHVGDPSIPRKKKASTKPPTNTVQDDPIADLDECPDCSKLRRDFPTDNKFLEHVMNGCTGGRPRNIRKPVPTRAEDELLMDLDDCPNCLKPRTKFARKGDFFTHVKTGACRWGPREWSESRLGTEDYTQMRMLDLLEACPTCLRLASSFTTPMAFKNHVRFGQCKSSDGTANERLTSKEIRLLTECPSCKRAKEDFKKLKSFMEHARLCSNAPGTAPRRGRPPGGAQKARERRDVGDAAARHIPSHVPLDGAKLLSSSMAVRPLQVVWDATDSSTSSSIYSLELTIDECSDPCSAISLLSDVPTKDEQLVWDLMHPSLALRVEPLGADCHLDEGDFLVRKDRLHALLQTKRDRELCDVTLSCMEQEDCPVHKPQNQLILDEIAKITDNEKEKQRKKGKSPFERDGFGAGVRTPADMQELIRDGIPIPRRLAAEFALLQEAFAVDSANHFFMDTEFGVKSKKKTGSDQGETWPFDATVQTPLGRPIFSRRVDYGMKVFDLGKHMDNFMAKNTLKKIYNSPDTWGTTPAEIATVLHEAGVTDEEAHT